MRFLANASRARLLSFLVIAAALALVGTACSGSGGSANELPGAGKTLVFADYNWDSAQIQNRVVQYIAEHGYGYTTEAKFGDTIGLMTGLVNDDVDISMEIWLPNAADAWDAAQKQDPPPVEKVGNSLDDNFQDMFMIPQYVADEYPDLKTVDDLKTQKFMDLFSTSATGGKVRLVTCIPGWECEKINAEKFDSYGLSDYAELVNPGSAAGLFADLDAAYKNHEPWIGYLWGPTKVTNEHDLTSLQEAPYSEDCWANGKKCEYPTSEIIIAVNKVMHEKAQDIVDMLGKYSFPSTADIATEDWMNTNEKEPADAAVWFLQNYEDLWTQWIPTDVAQRVKDALASNA